MASTPAAGPDIPEGPNRNQFSSSGSTRPATGFTRQQPNSSKLRLEDRVSRDFLVKIEIN